MNDTEKLNLGFFFVIFLTLIFWIRYNLEFIKPILENSPLFFQLMLAILIIAIIRNVIGIKTYGVFGPAIIIFGIIKAELGLFLGLTIFFNIFIVAMLISLVLYPLKISSSFRVGIIISSLIAFITVFELVGELFHLKIFESAIFFPVLITAWFADKFIVQVEEVDWVETSKKLLGTIITIILVYFFITIDSLIYFISLNPETWILLIGLNFYLAMKSNFRLMDNLRFKKLLNKLQGGKNILSINERNRDYISKYNPINFFSESNKDEMKISLHQLGIPTSETYMFVEEEKDLEKLSEIIYSKKSFVIKPTKGLGGEGILVIDNKNGKFYIKDDEISFEEIKNHIKQILEGQYSNDTEDKVIIEEKIIVAKEYSKYFYGGVFDIRIIVFCGFPIMAMMRIPTKESKGLANIHKGAITVGIDMSSGKCINPQWKSRGGPIKYHPDTNFDLNKIKIHNWHKILEISCLAQGESKLNYVGVDVAISNRGPLILEINKRPGIEIQNANMAGLLKRLKFIEKNLLSIRFLDINDRIKLIKKYNIEEWE